ncbi:MAG: glycosyltransferase family 39 protein [Butyrivibrio sp.]|nr:glycosyltransferase family 39 protein [Butyrivibrio sp.]
MKFKKVFNMAICVCLLIGALLVLGCSILTTISYDMGVENDWPHYRKENIPLLILLLAAVIFVLYLLKKREVFSKNRKKLLILGLFFCLAYCLMLIFSIRPLPVNDSGTLDDIINSFVGGDYSELTNKDGYLYIWPFQLGYVLFGEGMSAIFGTKNYIAWDLVQLLSIFVTMWLLDKICKECFDDEEICAIMSLLSMGVLFFYNYVTYIYGDILSMAPQTLALYLMIRFMKTGEQRYGLGSGLSIAVAVMIKTNCEIAVIALLMTLLMINGLKAKDEEQNIKPSKRILIAVCMLIFVFGIKTAVNNHYKSVTGLEEIPKGSPSVSHIAMGLQERDNDGGEDGWYNEYNYDVFHANDNDTERTKKAAMENIKERLQEFKDRPLHCGKFFVRKFLTQWADSECISTRNLDLVSRHHEMSALGNSLVFGTGSIVIKWVMNVFMTLCYLGVATYLIKVLRNRQVSDAEMLMLLLIFGGMVFHEFWEGSSRYAMRYYIYQLPFAACGLKVLLGLTNIHKLKKI